jgi:hypothetical protein
MEVSIGKMNRTALKEEGGGHSLQCFGEEGQGRKSNR